MFLSRLVFGTQLNKHVIAGRRIMADNVETIVKRARSDSKTIGTHSGTFHCDEVLACFMLRQLPEYENSRILRSRDDKELQENCDIIVDVGGEFNHENKWYDHHQKSFKETFSTLRPELGEEYKIRLSSAGLVYVFYGERVLESILLKNGGIKLNPQNLKLVFKQIYNNFISEIDAIDNGVPMFEGENVQQIYKISTNISARIGKFNPSWDEDIGDVQKRFEDAMTAVGQEFTSNVLTIGGSWINAREYVRHALENAKTVHKSGEILVLERFCPWKVHLFALEKECNVEGIAKLIIFSENENSWRVAGVPITPDSFLGRKFLPLPWRGLRDEELSQVAGIENLVFVHHTGFIAGAKTKEAAMQMAIKSMQWTDDSN